MFYATLISHKKSSIPVSIYANTLTNNNKGHINTICATIIIRSVVELYYF